MGNNGIKRTGLFLLQGDCNKGRFHIGSIYVSVVRAKEDQTHEINQESETGLV